LGRRKLLIKVILPKKKESDINNHIVSAPLGLHELLVVSILLIYFIFILTQTYLS